MARRSRTDIINDILSYLANTNKPAKPTHVMYKSNLSHKQMQGYLNYLEKNGFITRKKNNNSEIIQITDNGYKFLNHIKKMKEFESGFGL